MSEPSRRSSRLALTGALLAVAACTAAGFVLGRSTAAPAPPAAPRPPATVASPTPTPVPVEAPSLLSRAELISAAGVAIDRMAGDGGAAPQMLALQGRRFELRLPFGCAGPSDEEAQPLRWRYDEATGTLRISAAPVQWSAAEWVSAQAQPGVAGIEGFWIERPWTSSEACPGPTPAGASPLPQPAPQTLGLAVFTPTDGPRTGRRTGEAYTVVKKVAPDDLKLGAGLRLRLTGRIAAVPGAGPVVCRALTGPDRRPTCLIAVALDEVAVEVGATRETLATWTIPHQREQRADLGAGKDR